MQIENGMVVGAQALLDRAGAESERRAEAYDKLMTEVINALGAGNGDALVSAPGWGRGSVRAREVLFDALDKDELQVLLLGLIGSASNSIDPAARLCAQALVMRVARDHADYHVDDALEELDAADEDEAADAALAFWERG